MSEMVERVARAIDPIAFSMMDELGKSAERRDKAREKARAAIAAMREPNERSAEAEASHRAQAILNTLCHDYR